MSREEMLAALDAIAVHAQLLTDRFNGNGNQGGMVNVPDRRVAEWILGNATDVAARLREVRPANHITRGPEFVRETT